MLLGAVELGLVAYASIEVANSAKAAAQYGAQSPGTAAETAIMQQLAVNEAADYGLTLNTPISVTSSGACAIAGTVSTTTANCVANGGYLIQILTINTSADYTPLFKIPGIGPTFTVHGSAVQEVLF
jgi:Flp pilus assembly protein TadG